MSVINDDIEISSEMEVGDKRDIVGDGGCIKELVKAGTGWDMPEKGDSVTVHYTGTLEDGTKFDSSRDRDDPFTFTLGEGSVIKGWDVGVATMKKGERSLFTLRADYAYGATGSPPKIPPGATLIFDVELMHWKSVKDITGDGGVIKNIIKEGSGYSKPTSRDEIRIKLKIDIDGTNETVYESPESGDEFALQEAGRALDDWCKALAVAVPTMLKGEEVRLVVKPEYGFGADGRAGVPPDATLNMHVSMMGWKKVENVTPDGLVVKKTIVETEEWAKPNAGATVTVAYVAKLLEDGLIFEEKTTEDPLVFVTEEEQAPCEGFELAVMQMKKGETSIVTVDPKYAFGEEGNEKVPGHSAVIYEITLIDYVKAPEPWDLENPEKLESAVALKEKANGYFKSGNVSKAIKVWERAYQFIEFDDNYDAEQKKESTALKKSVDLNLAAAYLKLNKPMEARKSANKVLEKDPQNLKALYRRSQSFLDTGDWVEAEIDIKQGLALDSESTDFKLLQKRLKKSSAAAAKAEKDMWAAAFKKTAKQATTSGVKQEAAAEA